MVLVYLVLTAMIGGWQYLKFSNKHGLFYSLSEEYGGCILVGLCVLVFVVAVVFGRETPPQGKSK